MLLSSVTGNSGGGGVVCTVGLGGLAWASALGTGAQVGGSCIGLLGLSDAC